MTKIEKQLNDFANANYELFWQRQATLAGATLLAGYYINITVALICYGLVQLAELFECRVVLRILSSKGNLGERAEQFLKLATIGSVSSSASIVLYAIVIAQAEGHTIHLGPLFFLLAATLYAAMNNCQIPKVLMVRLTIYSLGFVFIATYDILVTRPPFSSELWMQLGVVLFVLYFLIECCRKFLLNYMTGLRQLEELRMERDRASEAYKMQSQFVSVVSHELRTPLTSVRASLDLLNNSAMGELPSNLSSVAKIGQKSSNHLAVLIDDLLDFQKLNAGKMVFNFAKIEICHFVREAVEVNRAFADKQEVEIRVIDDGQPLYVKADADRMTQVIGNVLSNAIKFSPPDEYVEVVVERTGKKCRISIRDRGVGIPEGSRDVVFGPFKQIDGSDKRGFGGTGLGMSITKKILESHGSTIDYVSELGVGTTFFFVLDEISADEVLPEPVPDEYTTPPGWPTRERVSALSIFPGQEGKLALGCQDDRVPEGS